MFCRDVLTFDVQSTGAFACNSAKQHESIVRKVLSWFTAFLRPGEVLAHMYASRRNTHTAAISFSATLVVAQTEVFGMRDCLVNDFATCNYIVA